MDGIINKQIAKTWSEIYTLEFQFFVFVLIVLICSQKILNSN